MSETKFLSYKSLLHMLLEPLFVFGSLETGRASLAIKIAIVHACGAASPFTIQNWW
jgi:hypothetical protein